MSLDEKLDAIEKKLRDNPPEFSRRLRRMEDFRFDETQGKFWDTTTGVLLSGHSVDGAIPREKWPATRDANGTLKPSRPSLAINNISTGLTVEGSTWWPGEPRDIRGYVVSEHGVMPVDGAMCFNTYQPPRPPVGDPGKAGRWRDLLSKIYPEEHPHLERYLAHIVQHPGVKANHGVILGGGPGIGKDTLLKPVVAAVGQWNTAEVAPHLIGGHFNGFLCSVLLRISEARDAGGDEVRRTNRWQLYEALKTLTAAPPDVHRVNRKHMHEFSVPNVCRVVVTTNHNDGVYLPKNDRRFFVCWSGSRKEDFDPVFWTDFYQWLEAEGNGHVGAYLAALDLSDFNPKAPPPDTTAKRATVDAGRDPNLVAIEDALSTLGYPAALTIDQLVAAEDGFDDSIRDLLTAKKNARRVPHLMAEVGYLKVLNPGDASGRFRIAGRGVTVYALDKLPPGECQAAAEALKSSIEERRGRSDLGAAGSGAKP